MKKPYVKGMYPNPGTLFPWKFVYIENDPNKWDANVDNIMKTSDPAVEAQLSALVSHPAGQWKIQRQQPNNGRIKMLSFILRRLLIIIPMALLVVTLTWGLIRLAPGNFYDSDKPLPPAIEANIKKKYGLDKPWYQAVRHHDGQHRAARFWRFAKISGPDRQRDHRAAICRIRRRWEFSRICSR